MITKVALDRLSRSLHSDVCDSDGLRDAAIHSTISGRGGRRASAASDRSLIHFFTRSQGTPDFALVNEISLLNIEPTQYALKRCQGLAPPGVASEHLHGEIKTKLPKGRRILQGR